MKKPIALVCGLLCAALLVFVPICGQAPAVQAATFVPWAPSDLNPGDKYHVGFLTFVARTADSTDIADYNAFVQGQSEQAGAITENWGVSWFVIGSTSSVDAKDNIPVNTAPIYLLSDVRLANNAADLWDGSIQANFSVNQFGNELAADKVWTGTNSDGTAAIMGPELEWLGTGSPRYGWSGTVDSEWVSFNTENKNFPSPFYAVSEELTVVPIPGGVWLLGSGLLGVIGFRRKRPKT